MPNVEENREIDETVRRTLLHNSGQPLGLRVGSTLGHWLMTEDRHTDGPLEITGDLTGQTQYGGPIDLDIIQRWFNLGLHKLRDFANNRGRYVPRGTRTLYPNHDDYRNDLSAEQVQAAAQKALYAMEAELNAGRKLPVDFDEISRWGTQLKSGCTLKTWVTVNPAGNEGNWQMANSIVHEFFHKYGDVGEDYISVCDNGVWEDDPKGRDHAQDVTDLFFSTTIVTEAEPPPLDAEPQTLERLRLAEFFLSTTADGSSPMGSNPRLHYRREGSKYEVEEDVWLVAKFEGPYAEYFDNDLRLKTWFCLDETDALGNEVIRIYNNESTIDEMERTQGICALKLNSRWLAYLVPSENEAEDELTVNLSAWCQILAVDDVEVDKLEPETNTHSNVTIVKRATEE